MYPRLLLLPFSYNVYPRSSLTSILPFSHFLSLPHARSLVKKKEKGIQTSFFYASQLTTAFDNYYVSLILYVCFFFLLNYLYHNETPAHTFQSLIPKNWFRYPSRARIPSFVILSWLACESAKHECSKDASTGSGRFWPWSESFRMVANNMYILRIRVSDELHVQGHRCS